MDKPTWAGSRLRRLAQLGAVLVLAGMPALGVSRRALAQMPPNPAPDSSVPGGELVADVLGWLKYLGLAAALAGLLVGGIAVAVGHFGSNYGAASMGRKWLLGGMGAAVIAGLAWGIVNTLYTSTS